MAVGKKETIHIDLTNMSEVGPMNVPGMKGSISSKITKSSKRDKSSKGVSKSRGDNTRRPSSNLNVNLSKGGQTKPKPKPSPSEPVKRPKKP